MGRESKYFGAPGFSPRELMILRYLRLRELAGQRWLRWRCRDRIHFGAGCRVDSQSVALSGFGRVELGERVVIDRGFYRVLFHLEPGSRVVIGRGTWFQTYDDDMIFAAKAGAEIHIGERCWFSGVHFGASERITVGEHTLIGWGCRVLDSDMHRLDNDSPPVKPAAIEIGAHVWMPSHITVLKGVRIGDHCVIGAGSLVTESIPPNSFAAGRPARVIKKIADRDRVE